LATITTVQENTDISNFLKSKGETNTLNIGAYNPSLNGTWRWRSGETWNSAAALWCTGEPCTCDLCGQLDPNSACWSGSGKAHYLCEHN
jgi:hypothetical protein